MGGFSQAQDSCALRISLLTCSPGEELYSTFGHTAIRVADRSTGTDIVYNYGTFDFDDPNFYAKFVRGKLLYYVSRENFTDFVGTYRQENRSVSEQMLNLSCDEKARMQRALFDNLQGNNKYYKYDFLFDNCTTRARDMVLRNSPPGMRTSAIIGPGPVTFRDHLHVYLDRGHMNWSELGIDILLGSKLDRPMTNAEAMFLPDFLEKGLDSTREGSRNEVISKTLISPRASVNPESGLSLTGPRTVLWGLLFFFAAIAFLPVPGKKSILAVADSLLFLVTGLLGLLLVFMWTGTDHVVCRNNYNLLWALPTHVLFAFLGAKGSPTVRKYFLASAILSVLVLIGWNFLPQRFHPALLPVVILLAWRSWKKASA
jgi:hypothetical protein